MTDSNNQQWRAAGSIMATFMVLMVGTMGSLAVAVMANPRSTPQFFWIAGGAFVAGTILVFGVMPRVSLPTGVFSWMNRRKSREEYLGYTPRLDKPQPLHVGTNAPPTVEEVRELKNGTNNWVPSRTAASRHRPSDR
jgi:hypothetical protein